MNQTKKHTTGKKLLALLLALIMTVSLLPMSVFAAEPGAEETPVVEGQTQPAAETGADDADQAQEPDADEANEDEAPVDEGEDTTLPGDEGDAELADTYAATDEIAVQAATDSELTFTTKNDFSYVALTNNNIDALPTDSARCRAVMLDCGRKYFTVDQIKKLIDYMSNYGYNQLQLSFGNGGCRLLLEDMNLTYVGSELTTDYLQKQIKAGNVAFNGDERCLTQEQMTEIIGYANGKGIEIVPMLNMPGHAKAIDYVISGETDDILNTSNNTVRKFAFALLKKYVDYFKGQGCKYFHFGSDESKESGPSMSTFLASCANIIANAGLRPRAFNDETNLGTEALPNFVQITYWISYSSNNSRSASELSNAGYQLINTHGNWYYVVNDGAAETGKSVEYAPGVRIELPTLKKAGSIYGSTWPRTEYNFYDNVSGQGSNVTGGNYKGTMFCIWCDNSTGVSGDAIISEETYGALTQLKALAELYWPNEIPATKAPNVTTADGTAVPATMTTGGSVALKADKTVDWTTSDSNVIKLLSAARANSQTVTGQTVTAEAVGAGTATITATDPNTKKAASIAITVQAAAEPVKVSLTVGESRTFDVAASVAAGEKSNNTYIATAKVTSDAAIKASVKQVTSITSGKKYLITMGNYVVTNTPVTSTVTDWQGASGLQIVGKTINDDNIASLSDYLWTITESGTDRYTVVDKNGKYLNINGNSSVTLSDSEVKLNVKNYSGKFAFSNDNNVYLDNFGGTSHDYFNTFASAWKTNEPADNNKWTLYEVVEASAGGNTLTITGTGEGDTNVTVGDTTYNIKVTALENTETLTVQPNKSITLTPTVPTGSSVEYTLGANEAGVTLNDNTVTASAATGTATVTAEVKNAGGYVTARYTYTITVSNINWDNVDPLPVELWITNWTVGVSSENRAGFTIKGEDRYNGSNVAQVLTVSVPAQQAYKEEGVLLSSLIPTKGYKSDETSVETVYWKGTVQTTSPMPKGDDLSASGVDFSRVRYWNRSWQYQAASGEWRDILTTNTVAAFYLQTNDVSPEITTGTQHYGNPPTADPGSSSGNGYALTAFAVVYPDGSLSRTEQEMYETGMLRGFWRGTSCNIGAVYAENNSTYRVSKMTVTWGANVKNSNDSEAWYTGSQSGTYGKDWGVKWDKVTNSAGAKWYDETTYWKAGDSEIPMIDGNKEALNFTTDYTYSAVNNNGKNAVLILIYLEAIEKETNLNVEYIDLNANNAVFHKYQIAMKYKEGDNEPTFTEKLMASDGTLIGGKRKWDSNVKGNPDYLPDDAYVANDVEKHQTFNKEITTIPDINGIYASGLYEYIRADISEDGKTLRLYYNLKPATGTTYVVDFGLPVVIPFTAFGIENAAGMTVSFSDKETQLKRTGNYGNGVIDMTAATVTYTLFKPLDARTPIPVYVTDADGKTAMRTVDVIPASTVYYEDSFVTFSTPDADKKILGWTRVADAGNTLLDVTDVEKNATQALEELNKKQNVYGYDPAYNNCTTFSMGSAMKTTVSGDDYATATFTFKGTGFDIISLTSNTSGTIVVTVTGDNFKKNFIVDTYYGYKYDETTKTWEVNAEASDTLYQIPVMKVTVPYGTYTATVTAAYNKVFDHKTNSNSYDFYLDAIRVYNPMGKDYDYTGDQEGYPQYIKLRDELANNSSVSANVVFIDGAANATVEQYKNYGPNNEVYLLKDQNIAFKLNIPNGVTVASVQIGAKAPMGTGKSAVMKVNGQPVDPTGKNGMIASATEMYYDITTQAKSGQLTITNFDGEGILSLTNLKITFTSDPGDTKVALGTLTDTEQANAVQMVRAMYAPAPEPDPEPVVFVPERFEASWSRSTVKVGQKATLTVKTSEDVEAITVDGVTIDTYRTRTQRTGWGWNAKRVTYREFTYTITAKEAGTLNCSVAAFNAENTASEAITAALTVQAAAQRPSWGGWLGKLFGRWF